MNTKIHFSSWGTVIVLLLSACTIFNDTPTVTGDLAVQATPLPTPVPALGMSVSADKSVPFNTVGQAINYSYLIGNTSSVPIPGPMVVIDDRVTVTCPEITTVGNLDNNLDANEALTCTGTYAITQLDLNAGSVTNLATASASGNYSSAVTTTVSLAQNKALTLSKKADPVSYNSASQNIIYSYVITNTGNVTLGPVQFTVTDDKIGAAFNCGAGGTILDPNGTISCSATYVTTEADLTAGSVVNSATASDGTTVSNTATFTISRGNNLSNLTPGSTIQHQVAPGEWLWQIARCYGADPRQVVRANSQLSNPAKIASGITVTVPNIGAGGRTIYGPPCIGTHTIQSGETWASIALLYNADPKILQDVNPGGLTPGNKIKVPLNSAGGT